jgi:hypothetical protein
MKAVTIVCEASGVRLGGDAGGLYTEDLAQVLTALGVEPGRTYQLVAVRGDELTDETVVTLSPDFWGPDMTFAVEGPGGAKTTVLRSAARAFRIYEPGTYGIRRIAVDDRENAE